MQKALAIARREIEERSFVFITAVILTLAPALALVVPRGTLHDRLSAFGILSLILAVGFTGGLAITLGASLVGRELTEKRMSFYFSRPVTGAQIWFGKLTAALSILMICIAIVFLPSVFFYPAVSSSWVTFPFLLSLIIGGSLFLLLIGHTLSTIFRARSAWIAVDFGAGVMFKIALFAILLPLLLHAALGDVTLILAGVAIVFMLVIAIGGAWQVARGRIDARRNHRELSKVLWTSLAVVLAIVFATVSWFMSFGPHDLDRAWVRSSAKNWILIHGVVRHRGDLTATFLYDIASGASIPVAGGRVQFDSTGTAAAWEEPVSPVTVAIDTLLSQYRKETMELVACRLAAGAKPKHTGIFINGTAAQFEITPDLSRLAVILDQTLTVYDVNTGNALASLRVPNGFMYMSFASPSLLRYFTHDDVKKMLTLHALDLTTRAVRTLVETNGNYGRIGGDGRTLVVWSRGVEGVPAIRLFDIESGRELPAPPLAEDDTVRVMRDGRLMVIRSGHISVYNGASLVRDIPLPMISPWFHGEIAPGKYLLSTTKPKSEAVLFDLERGAIVGRNERVMAESPMIFRDTQGRLVTWDGKPIL
jgi:ABC-type transport system involved in multi-copper enzyme maturation permease subunit